MLVNQAARFSHEVSLDRTSRPWKTRAMTESLPAPLRLTRSDPEQNMARFYAIAIEATLFGDVALVRTWGRIGTRGRTMFETCASVDDAMMSAERIIRAKARRGYV